MMRLRKGGYSGHDKYRAGRNLLDGGVVSPRGHLL
jgi:hypothetical protein